MTFGTASTQHLVENTDASPLPTHEIAEYPGARQENCSGELRRRDRLSVAAQQRFPILHERAGGVAKGQSAQPDPLCLTRARRSGT